MFVLFVDSSNLEIFLEMMNANEIILVVSHDDAEKKWVQSYVQRVNIIGEIFKVDVKNKL